MLKPAASKPLGIGILLAMVAVDDLRAYEVGTHATMSEHAYSAARPVLDSNFFSAVGIPESQRLSDGVQSRTARDWIREGSVREDDNVRSLFHFYDPYFDRGLLGAFPASIEWVVSPANDGSYPHAIGHLFDGLTLAEPAAREQELSLAFRALGQVIHLLQDAAQPQHVRNDSHLDYPTAGPFNNPSAYELFVDSTLALQPLGGYAPPSFAKLGDFFSDGSGRGLAELTNRGFVSRGTNCTGRAQCNSAGGYPLPDFAAGSQTEESFLTLLFGTSPQDFDRCALAWSADLCSRGTITFFGNQIDDAVTGATVVNPRMTSLSIFDLDLMKESQSPGFSLSFFNYDEQARVLLPRAVGYSAGLLKHFFAGSVEARASGTGEVRIRNASGEVMDGTFALYYDALDGLRHPLPSARWLLQLGPGMESAPLSFTAPSDALQPGEYLLVFRGSLGAEPDAVAGRAFLSESTLQVATVGQGSVSSSPAAIQCGSTCVADFPNGSTVTLTATPAAGHSFAGWSGDCSGGGFSVAVVLTGNRSCTATFARQPRGLCRKRVFIGRPVLTHSCNSSLQRELYATIEQYESSNSNWTYTRLDIHHWPVGCCGGGSQVFGADVSFNPPPPSLQCWIHPQWCGSGSVQVCSALGVRWPGEVLDSISVQFRLYLYDPILTATISSCFQ